MSKAFEKAKAAEIKMYEVRKRVRGTRSQQHRFGVRVKTVAHDGNLTSAVVSKPFDDPKRYRGRPFIMGAPDRS